MSSDLAVDEDVAFDALRAALKDVVSLDSSMLTTRQRLDRLACYEQARRRLDAAEHALINDLAHEATPAELGGKLSHAIADTIRISRADAARRVREAADLGERRALTGEPLEPVLAATAANPAPHLPPPRQAVEAIAA